MKNWLQLVSTVVVLVFLSPVVQAAGATIGDTVVDDFESGGTPSPWTFAMQGKGTTGSLTPIASGHNGQGVRLAYNNMTVGGMVSANLGSLDAAAPLGIGLWLKQPGNVDVYVNIFDSTGQRLQYHAYRAMEDTVNPTDWHRVVVKLDLPCYWFKDGANDGKIHDNIKAIGIQVQGAQACDSSVIQNTNTYSGNVDIDEVHWVTSFSKTIDPMSTPAPVLGSGNWNTTQGININYEKDDRALDTDQAAGFKWIRHDFFWHVIEPTQGVYDFSRYDPLVDALAARGMKVLVLLQKNNPIAPYNATSWTAPPLTPTQIAGFGEFAKAVAAHYAQRNPGMCRYEIYNEANAPAWHGAIDPVAYANLSKVAIPKVHEGDPTAKVSTGGPSGVDWTYIQGILAAGGAAGADAIAVHPYRQGSPETITDELVNLRTLIKTYIPNNPPTIWNTEWGYSGTHYGDPYSSDIRTHQARLLVRSLLTGWTSGMPLNIAYEDRDRGISPKDAEQNYGLLANNYSEKPAMVAVKTLNSQASGRTLAGVFPMAANNVHCLKLDGPDDVVLVIWQYSATTGSDPTNKDSRFGNIPSAGASVRLDFTRTQTSVTDYLGRDVSVTPGYVLVGEEPLYVRFAKPTK